MLALAPIRYINNFTILSATMPDESFTPECETAPRYGDSKERKQYNKYITRGDELY